MAVPTIINLSDSTPAAPTGKRNVKFEGDSNNPRNVSAYTENVGGASVKTATYTIVAGDNGTLLLYNSASAGTFTLPAAIPASTFKVSVQNIGAGVLTLYPGGALTLDSGTAPLSLPTGQGADVYTDGSNYYTMRGVPTSASPTFVQGIASTTPSVTGANVALVSITQGNGLILHVKSFVSTAPVIASLNGNSFVLIHSVSNSFWGVYTYTYICVGCNGGTDSVGATFISTTTISMLLAEYTPFGGYDVVSDNGVSANAIGTNTESVTTTKNADVVCFLFTNNAGSGITYNQTVRTQDASHQTVLLDSPAGGPGSVVSCTATDSMNQPAFTGLALYPAGLGTVTSVGITVPSRQTVVGSPVTRAGTMVISDNAQSASMVFAGPASGSPAVPTFRTLGSTDIPGGATVKTASYTALAADYGKLLCFNSATPVTVTLPAASPNSTWGLSVSNIGAGVLTLSPNGLNLDGSVSSVSIPQGQGTFVTTDGTNYFTERGLPTGVGTGSVTSVAMTVPARQTVSGSPITGAGTLAVTDNNQAPAQFFAGPGSGLSAAPAFRSIIATDIPIGGVSAKTANYTALTGDSGKLLSFNSVSAVTLTLPASPPNASWNLEVSNIGAGLLTVSPNGLTLDGSASSLSVPTNQGLFISTDGTNYFTTRGLSTGLSNPMTTIGDTLYGGASGIPTRLAVGSTGNVYTVVGGLPAWAPAANAPVIVGFIIANGALGTNVGPMLAAVRAGSITKCVVTTKVSDASALQFKINQNGTNIFSSNPSVGGGTSSGTVSTFTSLTSSPLTITANDVFSIDIISGTATWQFTAVLE